MPQRHCSTGHGGRCEGSDVFLRRMVRIYGR
jgi:hypothetical protein